MSCALIFFYDTVLVCPHLRRTNGGRKKEKKKEEHTYGTGKMDPAELTFDPICIMYSIGFINRAVCDRK